MKITKRQLRRIIKEAMPAGGVPDVVGAVTGVYGEKNRRWQDAHARGDLGKNIADADFPIVVGYELNGRDQSEIAYNQDELDDILDDIAGGPGSKADIPYRLDSLSDLEPQDIPAGLDIENLAAGKTMRVTKNQLLQIISEIVTGSGSAAEGGVELTSEESIASGDLSSAWPGNVTYEGHNVYEMFYKGGAQEEAWSILRREGYDDGQEAYLGFDRESEAFIMGFDAFLREDEEEEYYGDEDDFGTSEPQQDLMDGVLVEFFVDSNGVPRAEGILEVAPGGMYPMGLKTAQKLVPQLVDIRLD